MRRWRGRERTLKPLSSERKYGITINSDCHRGEEESEAKIPSITPPTALSTTSTCSEGCDREGDVKTKREGSPKKGK